MTPQELRERTEVFSRAIVRFCTPLLDDWHLKDTARQLLRSGTAVESNYGSAQCGRSHDEFTSKIGQVVDDVSESRRWLALLRDSKAVVPREQLERLLDEATQLTKIFAASYATAKRKQAQRRAERKRRPMTR